MNVAADPPAVSDGARSRLLELAGLLLRNDEWAEAAVEQTLRAAREQADGRAHGPKLIDILKDRIAAQLRARRAELAASGRDDAGVDESMTGLFDADGRRVAPARDWADAQAAPSNPAFLATLQACLAELPPTPARVFLLREWMNYDTAAICRTLGISATDCQAQLLLARLRLAEGLQRRWFGAASGCSGRVAPG